MVILVCPPDHPILQRFTEDDQGDKCYSDDHRGHFLDYVCPPGNYDFYAGPPYCITLDSGNSPCRTSGMLMLYIELLLKRNQMIIDDLDDLENDPSFFDLF